MGNPLDRKVNVVTVDGRIVSVPADQAQGDFTRPADAGEVSDAIRSDLNEQRSSGLVEGLKAAGEGALDTLTFGGYGKAAEALLPDYGHDMQIRAQERPGSRLAGEAAALLAPGGLLGDTAKAATEFSGVGLAAKAGEATTEALAGMAANPLTRGMARAVGAGGRVVEGGLVGMGGYIANSNVTGDPLSVEGALSDAGIGSVLGVAMGGAADWLGARAVKAQAAKVGDEALKADIELAKAGDRVFKDPPPTWDEVRVNHITAQKEIAAANKAIVKQARAYEEFAASPHDMNKAADEAQNLIDDIRNERYAKAQQDLSKTKTNFDATGQKTQVEYTYENGNKETYGYKQEPDEPRTEYLKAKTTNVDQRPVISEETQQQLRGWEKQISDARKQMIGGYRVDESGKWIKDASVKADPRAALEKLRSIREEMAGKYSTAGRFLKTDLPDVPTGTLKPELPAHLRKLPANPRDFARMHADSISQIASNLDPGTAQAFERFAGDIGVEVKQNPAETFAGVHNRLNEYVGTMDRLQSQASELAAKEADKPTLLKWANHAMRYAVGRAADVGGFTGAITRTMAGEAVGRLANGLEDSLLAGKAGVSASMRNVVAKYGLPTAGVINKLRPVTEYLATAFPTGERDSETDIRKQAANRINDINTTNMVAPNALFKLVQPVLDHPMDLGYKLYEPIMNALQHLQQTAPKDPGTDTKMFQSNWTPAYHESLALAHRMEAVLNPMDAITRALGGQLHPAASETLWAVYPAMMNAFTQEVAANSQMLAGATYQQASSFSHLFRVPLTPMQEPAFVATIQGLYMQQAAGQQAAGRLASSTPRSQGSPGRPAAVQSSVAGSNVSNLIS